MEEYCEQDLTEEIQLSGSRRQEIGAKIMPESTVSFNNIRLVILHDQHRNLLRDRLLA